MKRRPSDSDETEGRAMYRNIADRLAQQDMARPRSVRMAEPARARKPLSDHALAQLDRMALAPVPSSTVNAGVADRLMKDGLVEQIQWPSPYATHKGRSIGHLQLTPLGRARFVTP